MVRLLEKEGTPVWGYQTGENISSLSISDDGGIITAATDNGRVFLWDKSGDLLWIFDGMGRFTQVMMIGKGEQGYLVNSDNPSNPYSDTIHQFDRNGTLLWETREPGISGASITSDGKYLIVGTGIIGNSEVRAYAGNGTNLWRHPAPDGLGFVAVSPDGNTIAAVHSYRVIVLDHKGELISEVIPRDHPTTLDVSPDGRYIATGGKFGLQVFNRSGYPLWQTDEKGINSIVISSDGRTIISGSRKTVSLFDKNGTRIRTILIDSAIGSLSVSAGGGTIVAGSDNETVFLIDPDGTTRRLALGTLPARPLPSVTRTSLKEIIAFSESAESSPVAPLVGPVTLIALAACALIFVYRRR